MPRKQSSHIEKADTWAALANEIRKGAVREPQGKDWLKTDEAIKALGTHRTRFFSILKPLVASGAMEVFEGTARFADGKVRPCVWYRPKVGKTT